MLTENEEALIEILSDTHPHSIEETIRSPEEILYQIHRTVKSILLTENILDIS